MTQEKNCLVCGKRFMAKRIDQVYCGANCRKIAFKKYRKEWGEETRARERELKAEKMKKPKINSVAEIAVEARKAGMSYGQYVAMKQYGMR